MACLFLKAKIDDETSRLEPMLSGGSRSLAASLDYAITKQPAWILDMFGVLSNGKTQTRRLFRVTNSHRKRGGPVSISLNMNACPRHCIEITLDGGSIECPQKLRILLESIEAYGVPTKTVIDDEEESSSEGGEPLPDKWLPILELKVA
jgi:hypothetical protein